jgi:hypothetical protein
MSRKPDTRNAVPLGPVLTLMLVGVLLLSALLDYRAVKIQRFLEPALALTVPRSEFSHQITHAMASEFGASAIEGIEVRSSSLLFAGPLIFASDGGIHRLGRAVLRRTAAAFRTVLRDERTRPDVSFVMLIVRYPGGLSGASARRARNAAQDRAWRMLDVMFREVPDLEKDFGHLFSAVAAPAPKRTPGLADIEFRIVPSERMHIEFLQKLEKYTK